MKNDSYYEKLWLKCMFYTSMFLNTYLVFVFSYMCSSIYSVVMLTPHFFRLLTQVDGSSLLAMLLGIKVQAYCYLMYSACSVE